MLESAVYEFLREETKHQVLLKPIMEICEVYAGSDTIIVQNLITETPVDQQAPASCDARKTAGRSICR